MSTRTTAWRAWPALALMVLLPLAVLPPRLGAQEAGQGYRAQVASVLGQQKAVGFAAARQALQDMLRQCLTGQLGEGCQSYVNYSLGFAYQTEAAERSEPADSLLEHAVAYYDQALAADQENWGARYNKALAYRAMGANETQEAYFREAAQQDPARRAAYLSLLGDYHLERQQAAEAARAYRDALAADPADEGARVGLIEAYRAMGPAGLRPLFEQAEQWRMGFEASAEEAYAVLLEGAVAAGARQLADTACIRLVALQQHVTGPFLTNRPDLPSMRTWAPAQQADRFVTSPAGDSAAWWRRGTERRQALARATLQRGMVAAEQGDGAAAAGFFSAGVELAEPRSAEAVELYRQQALLYTRQPSLDPQGARFRRLEDMLFEQKGEVLASGDLEAAQRFHTTLALIYAERGAWRRGTPFRNVADQVSLALRAAAGRERRESFYQPLPELRALMANVLERGGVPKPAADSALSAARAWLDLDDVAAADSMLGEARRLGAAAPALEPLGALTRLRATVNAAASTATPEATTACSGDPAAGAAGAGPGDFVRRQRFKIVSDCAPLAPAAGRRELALAALAATDTAGYTLQGLADVRRFQRALELALGTGGQPYLAGERTRLATAPLQGAPSLVVALRNETVPRWLIVPREDLDRTGVFRGGAAPVVRRP